MSEQLDRCVGNLIPVPGQFGSRLHTTCNSCARMGTTDHKVYIPPPKFIGTCNKKVKE